MRSIKVLGKPGQLEPTVLDTFLSGTIYRRPLEEEEYQEFVIQEENTKERIVVGYKPLLCEFKATTIYNELLCKVSGNVKNGGKLTIKRFDEKEMGWICLEDAMADIVHRVSMRVEFSSYEMDDVTNDYVTISEEDPDTRNLEQIAFIKWDQVSLEVTMADQELNNNTKMVILMKAMQLALTKYSNVALPCMLQECYTQPPPIPGALLGVLKDLTDVQVVNVGQGANGMLHYDVVTGTGKDAKWHVAFEFDKKKKRFLAKNRHGIIQFHCHGIEDQNGNLVVNLHGRRTIGWMKQNMRFYDCEHQEIMVVKGLNSPNRLPYAITSPPTQKNFKILASVDAKTPGKLFRIQTMKDLEPIKKALIYCHAFKIAFHYYGFDKPLVTIPSLPSYRPYNSGAPTAPATLDKLRNFKNVSIRKLGQDGERGVNFLEVHEDEGDTVLLVFEVVHKLASVEAVAKDISGFPQFSAFGLWNMEQELLVTRNSGEILAINRQNRVFDSGFTDLARIQIHLDPTQDEMVPQPLMFKLVELARGQPQRLLAEIREGELEAVIEFKEKNMGVGLRALALSYALKVFYNEFHFHKIPMPDTLYEYV